MLIDPSVPQVPRYITRQSAPNHRPCEDVHRTAELLPYGEIPKQHEFARAAELMPVLSPIALFAYQAAAGPDMVDDAPYQQELVRRDIDQATGNPAWGRNAAKRTIHPPPAGWRNHGTPSKHHGTGTRQNAPIWNAYTSLHDNRELGLIVSDHAVLSAMASTFAADFRDGSYWA
jgi:hypothetical protein